MDSKMKHRILGVVVVAGLAVLAYPFVIGGSSMPAEQVVVKAPPFPEQAVQVSAADDSSMPSDNSDTSSSTSDNSSPAPDANADSNSSPSDATSPDSSTPPDSNSNTSSMNDSHSTVTNVSAPSTTTETVPPAAPTTAEANVNPSAMVEPAATENNQQAALEPEAAPQPVVEETAPAPAPVSAKKVAHKKHKDKTPVLQSKLTSKSSILAYKKTPIDNNGLMKLKKAAWVIQIGSFKDKSNALRLVNKLRAKGYRAFIQHVNVASGENTRVFVGPEHQQASARLVASDLKKNMKLQGIVISYKPFAL